MMVLLKDACTCATPSLTDFRIFLRTRVVFVFAIRYPFKPYYLFAYFFLPAIVRRGPLRVRALVRVRCPRQGKPRR